MKRLNDDRMRLMFVGFVVAVVLGGRSAKADFIVGEPNNIGPTINNSGIAIAPGISADSLELYFMSWGRLGGYGDADIWVATRPNKDEPWREPKNLGPTVNSPHGEYDPSISGDGLSLYFSDGLWDVQRPRPGGFGGGDIWVTRRETPSDPWGVVENLGSIVNSSATEGGPGISADGLSLFFESNRPGGPGTWNLWGTTRASVSGPWGPPVNLGPGINSSAFDAHPDISSDGLALFFQSRRSGHWDIWMTTRTDVSDAFGSPVNIGRMIYEGVKGFPSLSSDGRVLYFTPNKFEIWQAPIVPIVDFDGDGIVDSGDMCIMVDHWGENYPLCDIGPMPWGDGIVDVQDLIVLAEHLFEEFPPAESVEVDEKDDGGQVELDLGRILIVTLESNPSTGYRWEQAEDNASILEQLGEAEFKPSDTGDPPLVGAGGWEIFRFKAMSAGQMTLNLVYHRPWEEVKPLKTFSIDVVVH